MTAFVPDLLDDFISALDLSAEVVSISGNDVTVGNTFQARKGLQIMLDNTAYTVASVNHATETITLTAPVVGSPTTYSIGAPFFFHGTAYMVGAHISKIRNSADKMPMVFLNEIISEQEQGVESVIERVVNIRLFFLDEANFKDWNTDDHYSFVIAPLRKLVNAFISQIREAKEFEQDDETFDIKTHVNFGAYQELKGHIQSIFNERTSGIELGFTLNIKKCCNC